MVEDYDEILIKMCKQVKRSGIDLEGAFKLFDSDQDGEITHDQMR